MHAHSDLEFWGHLIAVWYQCHIPQTGFLIFASLYKTLTFPKDFLFLQMYNFIYSETVRFRTANRNK